MTTVEEEIPLGRVIAPPLPLMTVRPLESVVVTRLGLFDGLDTGGAVCTVVSDGLPAGAVVNVGAQVGEVPELLGAMLTLSVGAWLSEA